MKQTFAAAVAGVVVVACAALLAGCGGHSAVSQPANDVVTSTGTGTSTGAAAQPAPPAGSTSGASDVTAPAAAGVASDVNSIDGQLSGLDSELAQAAQSPSDGG